MTSGHTVAKENSDGVAQSRLIKREPDNALRHPPRLGETLKLSNEKVVGILRKFNNY